MTGGRKAIIIHVCRPPPLVSSRTPPLPILHQKACSLLGSGREMQMKPHDTGPQV